MFRSKSANRPPARPAIALLLAGVIAAIIGLISAPGTPGTASANAEPRPLAEGLDPVSGLAPVTRIVDFWALRADASPSDYLSRTQLGFALLTQARETYDLVGFEEAENAFAAALDRNRRHAPAQLGLGQAVHAQHRFAEAAALASSVLAAAPDRSDARLLLADAQWELGERDAAAAVYDELARSQRTAPMLSRLAKVAAAAGDAAGAVELAKEAIVLSDASPLRPSTQAFYRFQVAHFLAEAERPAEAIEFAEAAVAIEPRHLGAVELLGGLHLEAGDLDAAADRYRKALQIGAAADLHGTYAEILALQGDHEGAAEQERIALELAEETIDRFPSERRHLAEFFLSRDPHRALALAELDLTERQDPEAFELLERARAAVEALATPTAEGDG
ncbi:MAG: tetratricopeptide repeat protein [Actinomycetota bacterium]